MANGPWILPNFKIVATFVALIAPKVNLVIFVLDKLKAEGLVPAFGENIERNLTANAETQVKVTKLLFEYVDEVFPDVVLEVIFFICVPLFAGTISTDGRNIDHASTALNMI